MATVTLVDRYRQQWKWRSWPTILDALPELTGATVLDLGCGIGDLAAELARRGAQVIGYDVNAEAVAAARARGIAGAEFETADLRALPPSRGLADGLWCSFTAAYFTDFSSVLPKWCERLRPGAWIALTEIDDLFGHRPLSDRAIRMFEQYRVDALSEGRYDFRMGRNLRATAEAAGLTVAKSFTVPDAELAFDGPASADVIAAWRERLDGMSFLRAHGGDEYAAIRDEFLEALASPEHHALACVHFVLARRDA